MNRSVLACDPGYISGLVWRDYKDEYRENYTFYETDFDTTCSLMESICEAQSESISIVCEKYVLTARSAKLSQQTTALEVIGVVRYLAKKYGHQLFMQPPSAKARVSDDFLKQNGLYQPSKDKHQIDAAKHLVAFAIKNWIW